MAVNGAGSHVDVDLSALEKETLHEDYGQYLRLLQIFSELKELAGETVVRHTDALPARLREFIAVQAAVLKDFGYYRKRASDSDTARTAARNDLEETVRQRSFDRKIGDVTTRMNKLGDNLREREQSARN